MASGDRDACVAVRAPITATAGPHNLPEQPLAWAGDSTHIKDTSIWNITYSNDIKVDKDRQSTAGETDGSQANRRTEPLFHTVHTIHKKLMELP